MSMAEEQEQKLVEFLSILGDLVDVELAKVLLESADWDVETAMGGALDNAGPAANALPTDQHVFRQPSPGQVSGLDDLSQFDVASASSEPQEDELDSLSAADIKAMLDMHEVDHSACVEKSELVALLRDAMSQDERRNVGFHSCSPRQLMPEEQAAIDAERDERSRVNAEFRTEVAIQDSEYQESLLMDQMREIERQSEEAANRELREAEERSAEEARQASAQRQEDLEVKRRRIEERPEPERSDPERCQLLVRTPSGKRVSRVFRNSDGVSVVYDWVDVVCADEEFTRHNYRFVSQVPGKARQELAERSATLKEQGLENQTMLLVERCA